MEKNELEKRKALEVLEVDFDEVMELFNEDTLNSMKMTRIIGGTGEDVNYACPTNAYCPVNDCNACTMKPASCLKSRYI